MPSWCALFCLCPLFCVLFFSPFFILFNIACDGGACFAAFAVCGVCCCVIAFLLLQLEYLFLRVLHWHVRVFYCIANGICCKRMRRDSITEVLLFLFARVLLVGRRVKKNPWLRLYQSPTVVSVL
eukprot:Opistho-2@5383